ncbi:MAG: thiol reductant ABC exporter subunit CydC, partial [Candidatus Nanopelagicales bacterium]
MSGRAPPRQAGALRRVAMTMRPERRRLALASLLGASATLCAIGLLAVSGWLISRASQMPPVFTLTVAIVAVRGFGIGRGFFRYAERLVAHDAVLRSLTTLRLAVWNPLERLAPHGLDAFRRGDLLARFVADVDSVQEFAIRVVLPVTAAVLAGGVSVVVTWWLLPAAGAVLLTVLILGATLVPLLTVLVGARAERATAPTRGELSAQVRTLLVGAADLLAAGSAHADLQRTLDTDAALVQLRRRAARSAGMGTGLGVVLAGTAVIGALLAGITAVDDGRLDGVNLAVVVLLPLAAYEAVATLPSAALTLVRVRGSAQRVDDLLDTTPPVVEPVRPLVVDVRGLRPVLRLRGVTVTWSPDARPALSDVDLDLAAGARVAVVGASGAGKSTLASVLVRFVDYQGSVTLDGHELRDL